MITDKQIADLNVGVYAYTGDAPVQWDHFEPGSGSGGICWGLKRFDDTDVVVLRGSTTFQDWLRDFSTVANPFSHNKLGPVHPGFLVGLPETWATLKSLVQPKWICSGHSLGAGRAAILTAIATLDGHAPISRVVFGEPKPAFVELAKLIEGTPGRSYRNGDDTHHDLVTDVPFSFPPEYFVHPTPIVPVTARPTDTMFSGWGIFSWHHMPLYAQAVPTT